MNAKSPEPLETEPEERALHQFVDLVSDEGAKGAFGFILFAALGGAIGLLVAGLEWFTIEVVLHEVSHGPRWLWVVAPGVGLALAAAIRRAFHRHGTSTSDAYVKAFHSSEPMEPVSLGPKLAGSIATIGSGGAVGLEGPSILLGSTIGQWIGRRWPRIAGDRSDRLLLIAGAAAGVAAVFKAPATGVLFALESPYRRDISRHALVPALIASASAYLTFVSIVGDARLIPVGRPELDLTNEIGGAIVLGLTAGIVARGMARLWRIAKDAPKTISVTYRLPLAMVALGLVVLATNTLVELPVSLGPGAEFTVEVVLDNELSVWVILALFALRATATSATLAGGGVGGVFIPLAVQGLLLGRIVQEVFDAPSTGLFPVVGLAAVLGAGYRTPLAAVMFVAETTGRAEFVIPALIATALAQVLMGEESVSSGQISARQGALERRLTLPASAVAITDMGSVAPTESLLEIVDRFGVSPLAPAVPVEDETGYVGLLVLHDIANAMFTVGIDATAGDCMRTVPSLLPEAPAIQAARLMNDSDTAAVAIVDDAGQAVGIVSAMSLAGLKQVENTDFLDR